MKAHQDEIKDFISKAENIGSTVGAAAKEQAMAAAKEATSTENLNKAAQLGLQAQAELNKQSDDKTQ